MTVTGKMQKFIMRETMTSELGVKAAATRLMPVLNSDWISMGWNEAPMLSGTTPPAFVIVSIACHVGLRTTGGTQGVGKSTTVSVVAGSVAVIAVDFFVTRVLISVMYP